MTEHATYLALKRLVLALSATFCLSGCGFIWPILPTLTEYKTTVQSPAKGSFEGIKTIAIFHPAILGAQEDPAWIGIPITEQLSKNKNFQFVTPNQVLTLVQKKGSVPAITKTTSMTETERGDHIKQVGKDVGADALIFIDEKVYGDAGIILGPRFKRTVTMSVVAIPSDTLIWKQEAYGFLMNTIRFDNPEINQKIIEMLVASFNQTAK